MREELAELAEMRKRLGELSQLRERLDALEAGHQDERLSPPAASQG
jgi:predicted nuclease with TOPRIM domain